jgi:hypothetical protein
VTAGQLTKVLEGVPPRTPILASAPSHSLRLSTGYSATALLGRDGWMEDYGEDCTPEGDEFGERRVVVIVN